MKKSLLDQYKQNQPQLNQLEERVLHAVHDLLNQAQIKVHSITSRIKSAQSLEYKLRRPDRTYDELEQITDLVGVRLITYFEDHIDTLAALIEQHFDIDYQRSIDKRNSLEVSHFGYQSLHYICRLPGHQDLQSVLNYSFEIQIRTILQHTWAEIEHDLGYKTSAKIPTAIRRRFSRVAGLLELADDEFIAIRHELEIYSSKAQQQLNLANDSLALDQVSLKAFLQDLDVIALEAKLAERLDLPLGQDDFYPDYLIRMLQAVEMRDVTGLRHVLLSHQAQLMHLIQPYFEFTQKVWNFAHKDVGVFLRGYSLVFLAHYLILKSSHLGLAKLDQLTLFYQTIDYPHDEAKARLVAEQLIETLQEVGWKDV